MLKRVGETRSGWEEVNTMARPDRTEEGSVRMSVVQSVSVGQAAEELGVTGATIRNWITKGYLRAARLPSGHHRIPEREVERLLSRMFDFGEPQKETAPVVAAKAVASDEEWGP